MIFGVIRYNQSMVITEILKRMKDRSSLIGQGTRAVLTPLLFFVFFLVIAPLPAQAGKDGTQELWSIHHLDSASAISTYFLKQETHLSVRDFLFQVGRDRDLGPGWNRENPWWRQAEEALIETIESSMIDSYSSYEWMLPEWERMVQEKFDDVEVSQLIAHFKTNIGGKQASLIDHIVARQVMMSLTFSGKLKSPLKQLEGDLESFQEIYHREQREGQFVTTDLDGADAQAFALSHLGKKYFTTLIIGLTGRINERLNYLAARADILTIEHAQLIDPYITGFVRDN